MIVQNKTILVTGAGGGIGGELVMELLRKGAIVIAVDLKEDPLRQLVVSANLYAEKLFTYALDITDRDSVLALPEKIIPAQGQIDGIINCAGIIQPFVKVANLDFEAIERVMNVNFYGTVNMTKAFLPYLLKRPQAHLINVSSMGGFLPVPGQSVYGASKAAVKLLTEALYAELKDTNVSVSVVFPGATKTNITGNSGVAAPSMPTSDAKKDISMLSATKAAEIIVAGIEKNKPYIFTGKDSKLMNILYRINPLYATNLIAKQMKKLLLK